MSDKEKLKWKKNGLLRKFSSKFMKPLLEGQKNL